MRKPINIDLYAKLMLTVIAACLVGVCTGLDCQGNMPAALPLNILDGAYAGPVVARVSLTSAGSEPFSAIQASYRVVEIVDGRIQTQRRGLGKNGPFDCQRIEPGDRRIVTFPSASGSDFTGDDTITATTARGFEYVSTTSAEGGLSSTGEGSLLVTPSNGGIDLTDAFVLTGSSSGQTFEFTGTTTGFLQRIGDNGTVPVPDGMDGEWILRDTEGGSNHIEIRSLRVVVFADPNGEQEITESDPVSVSMPPSNGVFLSFEAMTVFASDPIIRPYRIIFRGEVGPEGQITGETTFTTDGKDPVVLGTTLERVASPNC